MDINYYNGKLVALIQPTIYKLGEYAGLTVFQESDIQRCGLFYIKVEKDQFTDTIHVNLKPTFRDKSYFKEFNKDFTYSGNDLLVFSNNRQRIFDQCEINKAHGFVEFINKLLIYKNKVESNPFKFYIKYYNRKYYYKDNIWHLYSHKDISIINDKILISNFFDIPWEYDSEKITIKKYNIFKRFLNIFKKTNNMLNNI